MLSVMEMSGEPEKDSLRPVSESVLRETVRFSEKEEESVPGVRLSVNDLEGESVMEVDSV